MGISRAGLAPDRPGGRVNCSLPGISTQERTMDLKPAKDLAATASKPYPNDSADYRRARTALLVEEVELRRHIERVAAQRRELPLGGEPADYRFKDENAREVGLADLFGRHDTLVTYFWMYGPQRARPCPMCTAFLGSLDIPSRDITQRVAFAVLGRSPVERQLAFARERGWRNLKFFAVGDEFARDYRGLAPNGDEWPALDVWVKRDGRVHHFWGAELGGTQDPGQDPRGAPDPTPLWNILDLTPGGRGTDWYPKLDYASAGTSS
jgi:predicted dithiol-disulfide oxidoreductase (DUF899 family)